MSDDYAQNSVQEKYFKEIRLLLSMKRQIKKSVNNDICAPTAYLAKPIFRQCFIHTIPKIKIISVNVQTSFDQWSITRLIGGITVLNKIKKFKLSNCKTCYVWVRHIKSLSIIM